MTAIEVFAKLMLNTDDFDKGLSESGSKASHFGSTLASGLKTATGVAAAAVGAATTAVTAFSASSVKTGATFDKSMSQVAATMGKSMDQMANETGKTMLKVNGKTKEFEGNLRDFAQELGRNTVFSATQAADALNYMALAGYDTQKSMDMLPNVLNLAAAGNMDLARASDMVTDTETAFGLTTERTSKMVDEMAKAASTGNTSVEQLGDAFLVVGGLAQELNGGMVKLSDGTETSVDGVQELEIALTAMANAGVKGSEAGTHMRNILLKLSSPTDAGTVALEKLGVAIFDNEGKMRSLHDIFGDMNKSLQGDVLPSFTDFYNEMAQMDDDAILKKFKKAPETFDFFGVSVVDANGHLKDFNSVYAEAQKMFEGGISQEDKVKSFADMFNIRDLSAAEAILNSMDEDWDSIGESILNADGAAQKMADTQLDNLAGDVTKFKSALEGAQIVVSDQMTPSLREFVQFGTDGLSRLTDAFKEGGLSGAMTEFGKVLSEGLNMITTKIPGFVDAGYKLLAAFGKGIMDNMPVILDAAQVVFETILKTMAGAIPNVVSMVFEILNALVETIVANASLIADTAIVIIETLVNGLGEAIPKLMEAAVEIVTTLATKISESLPELIPSIVEIITTIAITLIDSVDQLIEPALQLILALAEGLIQALPTLAEKLPEIVEKIVTVIIDNAPLILRAAAELILTMAKGLLDALPQLLEKLPEVIESIVSALIDNLPTILLAVIEFVHSLIGAVLEALPEIMTGIAKLLADLAVMLVKKLPEFLVMVGKLLAEILAAVVLWIADMVAGIVDLFASYMAALVTFCAEFLKGIVEWIADVLKTVGGFFGDMIEDVGGFFKKIWDSFVDWIADIVKGITKFIANIVKDVGGFIDNIKKNVSDFFKGSVNNAKTFFSDIISNVVEGLAGIISKISNWIKDMKDKATEAAKGFVDNLVEGVKELPDKFLSIGKNIVDGVWKGIHDGWTWLTDSVKNLAKNLFDAAKDVLGIASPSKKFKWIGEMVDEGFAVGIDQYKKLVDTAIDGLVDPDAITSQFKDGFDFSESFSNVPNVVTQDRSKDYDSNAGFTQNITINSPKELDPAEIARQTRNASRTMVLAARGIA